MHRTARLLIVLQLCGCPQVALANGGGYSFGVRFTGAVAPFQPSGANAVRILDEVLDIDLHHKDASVVVRYSMKNVTAAPARVRFGFPVEAADPENQEYPEDEGKPRAQRGKELPRAIQQLKGYVVRVGGETIASRLEIEPFATGKIPVFAGSEALTDIVGWMVSEVTFPPGGTVPVEIRYAADYRGDETSVSNDTNQSPLTFVYRLSTGAVWNGPIDKGAITIRADSIPADEVEIATPRERFVRNGNRWTWAFERLEPTLADDISIRAVPGYSEIGDYDPKPAEGFRSHLERGGVWSEGHQRFAARASSTLAPNKKHSFEAAHLAQPWPAAPWCEGVAGNGRGEWVELEAARPNPLVALRIAPGFQSADHPELFEQNGRPARLDLVLNGEHRFTVNLDDRPGTQLIPIVGYSKPVSKVRLTIADVHPGSKYQDTCITMVVLYDRLSKPPEVHHAR
jgi:hypothetical protein